MDSKVYAISKEIMTGPGEALFDQNGTVLWAHAAKTAGSHANKSQILKDEKLKLLHLGKYCANIAHI